MRYSTILISTFAALSLSLTINQTVHTEEIETNSQMDRNQVGQRQSNYLSG